jgi:acid phosphatase
MALLAAKGITLTNYFGTTHPSEPQYCAIHGGDNFGMDNDNFNQIPANVSTIWDLLAAKDISFGEYQEDLPYPGFEGFQFLDPVTGADNYVRKHKYVFRWSIAHRRRTPQKLILLQSCNTV